MIRLQRELHEKSSRLTQVQQNFANLQEVKSCAVYLSLLLFIVVFI